MLMCLCSAHEREIRKCYQLNPTGYTGNCGQIGCECMGNEFEIWPINRRRPPRDKGNEMPRKDTRPRYKENWRDF